MLSCWPSDEFLESPRRPFEVNGDIIPLPSNHLTSLTSHPPVSPGSVHPMACLLTGLPNGRTGPQAHSLSVPPALPAPPAGLWQVYDVFLPPEWCLAFGFYGEAGIS